MDEANHQARSAAPTTPDLSQFSAASALGDITGAAVLKGELLRLHCSDGSWLCWGCGSEYAPFHVSLHCEWCLQQARGRRVERLLAEARRSDEDRRWEGMATAMATDSRLDREGAVRLLAKARELPGKTPDRMDALNLAFDRRFDAPSPRAGWTTYTAASAKGDPAEEWDRG